MNHIVLIGFMGAGKTTIGKVLAKESGRGFVDTDELIEQQSHMNINDIFEEHGESYFRDLETLTVRQLLSKKKPMIISVGGGLPLREENQILLRKMGIVVYLKAEIHTLFQRLENSTNRPILQGGDLMEKIERLMLERENTYKHISRVVIKTDGKSVKKVVEELKAYVQ